MQWTICFFISVVILVLAALGAVFAARKTESGRVFTPFHFIFAGVFAAIFTGLIPVFLEVEPGSYWRALKTIAFSAMKTIQVFTADTGPDFILENLSSREIPIEGVYSAYMSVLFVSAPILTFGFLLSLLKNILPGMTYLLHYRRDVYAFSELNEAGLLLQEDLKKQHPRSLFVFTDFRRDGTAETGESARKSGALFFQKDILSVRFGRHSRNAKIVMIVNGANESENLTKSLRLIEEYREREHTELYVFSSGTEGELLLSGVDTGLIKLRRINETRSLIYRFLYEKGTMLFSGAKEISPEEKRIMAVVLGLGRYGTEAVKALSWYCQMDGYTVHIHAFDQDLSAEDRFRALCPELMSEEVNGIFVPGESCHEITIHPGVDVNTKTFADLVTGLGDTGFVLVCLGSDRANINAAANVRMLFERAGVHPAITAVVYDSKEKNALEGTCNYRGQPYDITAYGDLGTVCSEKVLMGSELEALALQRHLKWGREEEFWRYEYNYRSSMAAAIHLKAKAFCGLPGSEKPDAELSAEERETLERVEHRRWNTYMRSEGYVYSGSRDSATRNDLAKTHHDLVPFEKLSESDRRKDSRIGEAL